MIFSDQLYRNLYLKLIVDFRQIFKFCRIMAVDGQSEMSFSILSGRCHGNQFLLRDAGGYSGADGRANVGLFPASSFSMT